MISSIPQWVSNLFGSTIRPNVKVLEIHCITPNIKKVRFQADISKWNFQIGYASVIRVSETEFRNYTVAHHNTKLGFFDIIFHIHGNGVGSNFVNNLKVTDELFISPPRGIKIYDSNANHYIFFGDETSMGLAYSFLSILIQNGKQCHFHFELDKENKNMLHLLGLKNYSVFSKNDPFQNVNKINNLPVFQTAEWETANYILTGNVNSVKELRNVIKRRIQGKINSQGYWLQGKKGL